MPPVTDGRPFDAVVFDFSGVVVSSAFEALTAVVGDQMEPAAALLLLAFGARLVISAIREPINELATVAKHLSRGDVSQPVTFRSTDEIGQLADAFREVNRLVSGAAGAADAHYQRLLHRHLAGTQLRDVEDRHG